MAKLYNTDPWLIRDSEPNGRTAIHAHKRHRGLLITPTDFGDVTQTDQTGWLSSCRSAHHGSTSPLCPQACGTSQSLKPAYVGSRRRWRPRRPPDSVVGRCFESDRRLHPRLPAGFAKRQGRCIRLNSPHLHPGHPFHETQLLAQPINVSLEVSVTEAVGHDSK